MDQTRRPLTPEEISEIERLTGFRVDQRGEIVGAQETAEPKDTSSLYPRKPRSMPGTGVGAFLTRLAGGVGSSIVGAVPSIVTTPAAAGIAGAAEALAQKIESADPIDKSTVGVEAGIGAIPLGKIYKAGQLGKSFLRGAGAMEAGNMLRRYDQRGEFLPEGGLETAFDIGTSAIGGLGGIIPMKESGSLSQRMIDATDPKLPAPVRKLSEKMRGAYVKPDLHTVSTDNLRSVLTSRAPQRGEGRNPISVEKPIDGTAKPLDLTIDVDAALDYVRPAGPPRLVPIVAQNKNKPLQYGRKENVPSKGDFVFGGKKAAKHGGEGAEHLDEGAALAPGVESQQLNILRNAEAKAEVSSKVSGRPNLKTREGLAALDEAKKTAEEAAEVQLGANRKTSKAEATQLRKEEQADYQVAKQVPKDIVSKEKAHATALKETVDKEKAHGAANKMVAAENQQAAAVRQIDDLINSGQAEVGPRIMTESTVAVPTASGKQVLRQSIIEKVEKEGGEEGGKASVGKLPQSPPPDPTLPQDWKQVALTTYPDEKSALRAIAATGKRGITQRINKGKWRTVFPDEVKQGEDKLLANADNAAPAAASDKAPKAAKPTKAPKPQRVGPFPSWIKAQHQAKVGGGKAVQDAKGKWWVEKPGGEPPIPPPTAPAPAPKPKGPKGGAPSGKASVIPVAPAKAPAPPAPKFKPRNLAEQDTSRMSDKDVKTYYKERAPYDDAKFLATNVAKRSPELAARAEAVANKFASGELSVKDAKVEVARIRQEFRQLSERADQAAHKQAILERRVTDGIRKGEGTTPEGGYDSGRVNGAAQLKFNSALEAQQDVDASKGTRKITELRGGEEPPAPTIVAKPTPTKPGSGSTSASTPRTLNQMAKEVADAELAYGELKDAVRAGTATTEQLREAGAVLGRARHAMATAASEAELKGQPVPVHVKPAAPKAKPAPRPKGKGPTNEDIAKMTPEQQEQTLTQIAEQFKKSKGRIKNQKGMAMNELMLHMGLSAVGAGIGAAANPDAPGMGALVGGAIGVSAPALTKVMARYIEDANLHPAEKVASAKVAAEFVKDRVTSAANLLPEVYRASLLSGLPNLPINAIVGPWGSSVMAGIELALAGDPAGFRILRNSSPAKFLKDWYKNLDEADELIRHGNERTEDMGTKGGPLFQKITGAPARGLVSGDITGRNLQMEAGLSEEMARTFTLTSEPFAPFSAGISNLRKSKGRYNDKPAWFLKMIMPFYRTNLNQVEQGLIRVPLLGSALRRAWKVTPIPIQQEIAQQVVSLGTYGAGYALGALTPEQHQKDMLKLVGNFGGVYGTGASLAFIAGMAKRRGDPATKQIYSAAAGFLRRDMPLPNADLVYDLAQAAFDLSEGETPNIPYGFVPPPISSKERLSIPTLALSLKNPEKFGNRFKEFGPFASPQPTEKEYSLFAPFMKPAPKLKADPRKIPAYEREMKRFQEERRKIKREMRPEE